MRITPCHHVYITLGCLLSPQHCSLHILKWQLQQAASSHGSGNKTAVAEIARTLISCCMLAFCCSALPTLQSMRQ
jgi:hypothetical protein